MKTLKTLTTDLEKQDKTDVYLAVCAAIVSPILAGFLGYITKDAEQAALAYISATVAFLSWGELAKRVRLMHRIDTRVTDIQQRVINLNDPVREIGGLDEVYRRVAELITNAKESVYDLTWGVEPPVSDEDEEPAVAEARMMYRYALEQKVKERTSRVVIRDLFGPGNSERARRIEQAHTFKESLDKLDRGRYHVRVFDEATSSSLPLIDFVVVDQSKVLFTIDKTKYLYCENSELAKGFKVYFEEIWRKSQAIPVKDPLGIGTSPV